MVNAKIVESVRQYLGKLNAQGISVSFAIVYGSQVRGDSNEWSDIDLVVVSPKFDDEIGYDDLNLLWRVAARTDSRIEPVACGERQWIEDTSSALIEIARREGERILPAA